MLYFNKVSIFKVDYFLKLLEDFPGSVIKEKRKRRAYISGVFARNEIHSNSAYNRKLFMRIQRGYYIFNPDLQIKQGDEWINIYKLLNCEATSVYEKQQQEISLI